MTAATLPQTSTSTTCGTLTYIKTSTKTNAPGHREKAKQTLCLAAGTVSREGPWDHKQQVGKNDAPFVASSQMVQ